MIDPWAGLPPGTLTDEDILQLAGDGQLITRGFDPERVRQACYELRASEIFYDLSGTDQHSRTTLPQGESFILKPHRHVTVIVMESIRLPANVLARILTKGQLFSIGILPVNTYADPGFEGRLGITLVNASNRYISISPGQPIAKIEFVLLPKPVARPYAGQHGYETQIWPIPTQYYADVTALKARGVVRDDASELEASYGPRLGDLARRVDIYSRRVWLQIALTLTGFAVLFLLYREVSLVLSFAIGITANFLTTFLWNALRPRGS